MTFCEDCGRYEHEGHGMNCPGEELDRLRAEVKDLKDQQGRLIEENGYAFQKAMNEQIEESRSLRAERDRLDALCLDWANKYLALSAKCDRYIAALERIIVENISCEHGPGYTCFYCVAKQALGSEAYQKLKDETKDYAGMSKWLEKRGQRTGDPCRCGVCHVCVAREGH